MHRNSCCDSCCPTTSCCQTTCCNTCNSCCCRESCLDKLRARRNHGCCCESSCCTSSCGGTVVTPKGEQIPSPKKMPGAGSEPPRGEVHIITPPTTGSTPALEVAPTAVPGLEADNRNPF